MVWLSCTCVDQATVYFAIDESASVEKAPDKPSASGMYWIGVLQVILQIVAAAALFYGTATPSCFDGDNCAQGMYCETKRDGLINAGKCFYCGSNQPIKRVDMQDGTVLNDMRLRDATGKLLPYASAADQLAYTGVWNMTLIRGLCMNWPNWPHDPNLDRMDLLSDEALINWCDRCVHFETEHVDPLSVDRLSMANTMGMRGMDWLALLVTAVVIALSFVGELKDSILCTLAARRGVESGLLNENWEWRLWAIASARRYMFLPALLNCVPLLVLLKGGDALSVCFNAVALLFLLSVDDLMFAIGMNERARAEVEVKGRVELKDDDVKRLWRTKIVHLSLVMVVVVFSVLGGGSFGPLPTGVLFPGHGWIAMWLGALDDELKIGGGAKRVAVQMAKVFGLLLIGFITNLMLMLSTVI